MTAMMYQTLTKKIILLPFITNQSQGITNMNTITELGVTFNADLLEQFIVLNQQGYSAQKVQEIMNLPQDVWFAVVQSYFGG
jgi:hypothetical protein